MKKTIIAIIAVIVIAGGAFALFHTSPKSMSNNSSLSASKSTTPATSTAILMTKTSATVGQYFAASNGMALYTYNADAKGVSNCTGSCLQSWPAYLDKGSTTSLPTGVGTLTRTDNGETQFTYNGLPLYFFAGDSTGQVTGNGVQNFSTAKPVVSSGSPSTGTSSPSSSASSSTSSSW